MGLVDLLTSDRNFYHVRISLDSDKLHDEVKLDLTKDKLLTQFIEPYEQGKPIITGGKTIIADNIERIKITFTTIDSSQILPKIRAEREKSLIFSPIPDKWYVVEAGTDVSDEFIKGPPGFKKNIGVAPKTIKKWSNKIFIVHGHDEVLKNEVELFVAERGLEPIVLHRQPDQGQTIIEKLEKYTDAGYAFILITPDDIGYEKAEQLKDEKDRRLEHRARQNVIFEFGYLAGKIGRNRVCCIYKKGTSLPTDLAGFLYKEISNSVQEKALDIIKELNAAGYEVKI